MKAFRRDVDLTYPREGPATVSPSAHHVPVASDNAAESKVLLYGPNGEPLLTQEPRTIGFRERRR